MKAILVPSPGGPEALVFGDAFRRMAFNEIVGKIVLSVD
jgi:hypothetical protein